MGFWLTELQQLEAVLAAVDADPAALANVEQVQRTLEPDATPDWAINEAVTTNLHRVFLMDDRQDYAQNHRGRIDARTRDVSEALFQVPGQSTVYFRRIIADLDGGAKPISTPAFWDTYFDLLAAPSEFRVLPRTVDASEMPSSWDTVAALQRVGQIHQATLLGERLDDDDSTSYRRARTPAQRAAREQYRQDAERLATLTERVERNMRLLDTDAVAEDLRALDRFVIDSPVANEAKGKLPELRRRKAHVASSAHTDRFVDVHRIEDTRRGVRNWAVGLEAAFLFSILAATGVQTLGNHVPSIALAVVSFVLHNATGNAVVKAQPTVRYWGPLAYVASAAAAVWALQSVWMGLLIVTVLFAPLPLLYRRTATARTWSEWNDLVHVAARLEQDDRGGGIHQVTGIEDTDPWRVTLAPLPGTADGFQRLQLAQAPEFAVGDYVVLDRAGDVHAHLDAARAEVGIAASGRGSSR